MQATTYYTKVYYSCPICHAGKPGDVPLFVEFQMDDDASTERYAWCSTCQWWLQITRDETVTMVRRTNERDPGLS